MILRRVRYRFFRHLGFPYGTPRFVTDYPSFQPPYRKSSKGTRIEMWLRKRKCEKEGHRFPNTEWSWKRWCMCCFAPMEDA